MKTINKSVIVPYTPEQMYKLVNDIERYPDFVPWCVGSELLTQDRDELRARLDFAKGSVQKSFATINRLHKNKMIEMRLLDGPFKHLEGFWRFEVENENVTKVSFDISFEFSNKIMGMMFGSFFQQVVGSLVDAFYQRAQEVYGD